ncbi:uncharacterized protein F4812DRAFT_427998 [Daldinia caldariorum]|uniref:uncharacterized protein n=1 Tax=Daldinia caldariorum TaxID=326644 RepID=UPI002007E6FD|nr:uncharacterized protein F4812DRAFT_427998 [Daldinia caldariorum]KAI1467883.1 hypothetical protein F4812DRAFT_427998 [Daldinia caldariorum]
MNVEFLGLWQPRCRHAEFNPSKCKNLRIFFFYFLGRLQVYISTILFHSFLRALPRKVIFAWNSSLNSIHYLGLFFLFY